MFAQTTPCSAPPRTTEQEKGEIKRSAAGGQVYLEKLTTKTQLENNASGRFYSIIQNKAYGTASD